MVRDYALAASGLLVPTIGGPSVKPYQPPNVWETVAMDGSNTRFYKADTGDKLYRRSLYTFWKRSAPPASMDIFNAPSREVCTVRRERTNTPLQALVTMNDPQFVEAAASWRRMRCSLRGKRRSRVEFYGQPSAGAAVSMRRNVSRLSALIATISRTTIQLRKTRRTGERGRIEGRPEAACAETGGPDDGRERGDESRRVLVSSVERKCVMHPVG